MEEQSGKPKSNQFVIPANRWREVNTAYYVDPYCSKRRSYVEKCEDIIMSKSRTKWLKYCSEIMIEAKVLDAE